MFTIPSNVTEDKPWFGTACKANRAFLQRAVYWLGKEEGITQFLDIGSGYPTNRNTHDVALENNPQAHVTYVDSDFDVVKTSRFILKKEENVHVLQGDVRYIKTWLTQESLQDIDFNKPVGILMTALLHFVSKDSEIREIINLLKNTVKPGSYLVISHASKEFNTDKKVEEQIRKFVETYSEQVGKVTLRTTKEITALLRGLEIVKPGVTPISNWKSDLPDAYGDMQMALMLACVAKS